VIKVLIIRFSSIGDIVLTTPVIRNLKEQGENFEIHYLTKRKYATILENNPYIDKLHLLDDSISELINNLKKEYFHYIIDLHKNLRTKRIKLGLRTISFEFDKINWAKWLMVNFKINKLPNVHIVDRYMDTIKFFIEKNDNKGLDYFILEKEVIDISQLPQNFNDNYIAFAIGAQHSTKKLHVEKIISICKKINQPIVLLGDKKDAVIGNQIKKAVGALIYNACGKYSLNQSASIINQANLLVTHDTGLMHIASALKKKIISVWGSTIPEFGMYPYFANEDSEIIEVKDLKCRPCSKIGYKKCPKTHFKCMNDIDENKIAKLCNL